MSRDDLTARPRSPIPCRGCGGGWSPAAAPVDVIGREVAPKDAALRDGL